MQPVAVDLSGILKAPVDLSSDIPLHPMPDDPEGTLILQVNGPETTPCLHHLGMNKNRRWKIIGYWAWELSVMERSWAKAFPYLSEIWAVSQFTAGAIECAPGSPPVQVVPHAIDLPPAIRPDRLGFHLPEDAFISLTMADSFSSMERKNTRAAIMAHKEAFDDRPDRILVVKTRNLRAHPDAHARLQEAIGDSQNIRVIDRSVSSLDRWSLIASADVLISLHRSEGFGLVIAEAMLAGKPVIVTDYSGNTDFTSADNACPVPFSLVSVDDPNGIYRTRGAKWAEPDIGAAAAILQDLATDPTARHVVGVAAQRSISAFVSADRIGELMLLRLSKNA